MVLFEIPVLAMAPAGASLRGGVKPSRGPLEAGEGLTSPWLLFLQVGPVTALGLGGFTTLQEFH